MPDLAGESRGIALGGTGIAAVGPGTGSLLIRGYPVQELASSCTVEQVAWLLWHGELPTVDELTGFEADERTQRDLPPRIRAVMDALPIGAQPIDVLRTAVSVLGASHGHVDAVTEAEPRREQLAKAVSLFAVLPAVVAYEQRRRRGQQPVPPRDDLDYARNFLWMTFGEEAGDIEAEVFRISMVLHAAPSVDSAPFGTATVAARLVSATLSDLHSAVVAAIGASKGRLHDGATEAVMGVLHEIASPDAVDDWLATALAEHRRIAGFEHRIDGPSDSRVPTMKAALDWLIAERQAHGLAELTDRLATAVGERLGVRPNLDFSSGPAFGLLGFDTWMFTPLLVASNVIGWAAHVMEQRERTLPTRPTAEYTGPPERHLPAALTSTTALPAAAPIR